MSKITKRRNQYKPPTEETSSEIQAVIKITKRLAPTTEAESAPPAKVSRIDKRRVPITIAEGEAIRREMLRSRSKRDSSSSRREPAVVEASPSSSKTHEVSTVTERRGLGSLDSAAPRPKIKAKRRHSISVEVPSEIQETCTITVGLSPLALEASSSSAEIPEIPPREKGFLAGLSLYVTLDTGEEFTQCIDVLLTPVKAIDVLKLIGNEPYDFKQPGTVLSVVPHCTEPGNENVLLAYKNLNVEKLAAHDNPKPAELSGTIQMVLNEIYICWSAERKHGIHILISHSKKYF